MSGHQLRMTHHENGERNVFEPDHYADKSFLCTHYWDLCWKLAYLTSEKKLKIECPDMTNGIDLRLCPLEASSGGRHARTSKKQNGSSGSKAEVELRSERAGWPRPFLNRNNPPPQWIHPLSKHKPCLALCKCWGIRAWYSLKKMFDKGPWNQTYLPRTRLFLNVENDHRSLKPDVWHLTTNAFEHARFQGVKVYD